MTSSFASEIPTADEAITYVSGIEACWGLPTTMVLEISVTSNGNHWSTWYQPDGTVYGEC